jgi:hypothetical protein
MSGGTVLYFFTFPPTLRLEIYKRPSIKDILFFYNTTLYRNYTSGDILGD